MTADFPDCPGEGIDDLCTWPIVEECGLCTLGLNPALFTSDAHPEPYADPGRTGKDGDG